MAQEQLEAVHAAGIGRSRLCLGESQNKGKEPGAMEDTGGHPMPPSPGVKRNNDD